VRRLPRRPDRRYASIFGDLTIARVGHRIYAVCARSTHTRQ
jgi:hypothetical protein